MPQRMWTQPIVPRLCQHYLTRSEHNINSDCVAGLSKAVGFLLSSLGLSEGTRIKGFAGFILQVLVLFLVDVKWKATENIFIFYEGNNSLSPGVNVFITDNPTINNKIICSSSKPHNVVTLFLIVLGHIILLMNKSYQV